MPWLRRLTGTSGTSRLVCVPHAGGGPSTFADWVGALPERVELWVPDLPARERRMLEDPVTDFDLLVRGLADELGGDDRPTSLFGHSFGALVAFEVARLLHERSTPVRCLVVSGMAAPQTLPARPAPTDEEILRDLRVNGSAPPELDQLPELVELVLPGLRADYSMALGYRYREGPRLSSAVVALSGAEDAEVDGADLARWAELTDGGVETRLWDDGHMYLLDQVEDVARFVADRHLGAGAR
ncbi:alpha/beta fold hydrolase [Saccharothrix sp. BKS2]|uniref:thioesterase II family protein n=1 Tax=Saccharothrix sp. BKS2 TaxID=3064400 RepID=UPI0039EBB25F